jgi:hypothetical protein
MQILFPGQHILTDVVVTHPLCPTHLDRAATGPCRVADDEAVKKSNKYAEVTEHQEGARFLPFAIETTGGLGRGARALIEQISLACRDHLTLQTHTSIARGLRASIAVRVFVFLSIQTWVVFISNCRYDSYAGQLSAAPLLMRMELYKYSIDAESCWFPY